MISHIIVTGYEIDVIYKSGRIVSYLHDDKLPKTVTDFMSSFPEDVFRLKN